MTVRGANSVFSWRGYRLVKRTRYFIPWKVPIWETVPKILRKNSWNRNLHKIFWKNIDVWKRKIWRKNFFRPFRKYFLVPPLITSKILIKGNPCPTCIHVLTGRNPTRYVHYSMPNFQLILFHQPNSILSSSPRTGKKKSSQVKCT